MSKFGYVAVDGNGNVLACIRLSKTVADLFGSSQEDVIPIIIDWEVSRPIYTTIQYNLK